MSNWHGGKGSKRRNSDEKLYADNWEKIFGKKEPELKVRKKTPSQGSRCNSSPFGQNKIQS